MSGTDPHGGQGPAGGPPAPGPAAPGSAYEALAGAASAHAAQAAAAGAVVPPAAPADRRPLLGAALVALALALAYALPRLEAYPPPAYEEMLPGAVLALEQAAEYVDAVQAAEKALPAELPVVDDGPLAGVAYQRLDERAYALTTEVRGEVLRLERRAGTTTLTGKGLEGGVR